MNHSLAQLPDSRRWRQQAFPVAIVGAIIRRDIDPEPRYLLIRRINEPYIGLWALVGGRWEFGETLAEAVTREVQEETGLTTTFVALHTVVNERLVPADPSTFGAHFVLFVCEVQALSGEPSEQAEGQVAWFAVDQLKDLHRRQAIVSTDYRILEQSFTASRPVAYVETEVRIQGRSESSTVRVEPIGKLSN